MGLDGGRDLPGLRFHPFLNLIMWGAHVKTSLILGVVLALATLVVLCDCGPVESTSLIVQADTAVHNANTADAKKKSPYEYYAAEQYLHKAREKWGTSDFEYAIDYAKDARDLANKAKERSLKKENE